MLYFVLPPKSIKMYGHSIRAIHGTTHHTTTLHPHQHFDKSTSPIERPSLRNSSISHKNSLESTRYHQNSLVHRVTTRTEVTRKQLTQWPWVTRHRLAKGSLNGVGDAPSQASPCESVSDSILIRKSESAIPTSSFNPFSTSSVLNKKNYDGE